MRSGRAGISWRGSAVALRSSGGTGVGMGSGGSQVRERRSEWREFANWRRSPAGGFRSHFKGQDGERSRAGFAQETRRRRKRGHLAGFQRDSGDFDDTRYAGYLGFDGAAGSFAGLGFLAWYLAGKIRAFSRRGHVAKLCIVLLPLLCASLIAISRVDDYWHHWQDVFAGGILGLVVSSVCYLQFFPPPYHVNGWGPHAYFRVLEEMPNGVAPSTATNALTA